MVQAWCCSLLPAPLSQASGPPGKRGNLNARPAAAGCLRNLVIGVLNRAGPVNLAAALRYHSRDPRRPLATLGITLG